MGVALILAMALAVVDTPGGDYDRAIGCAAGEATLAALLGGDRAEARDRATVERLNALSGHWLHLALVHNDNPAAVRADLARSKASLASDLASTRDAARLSATLDARLAACAPPIGGQTVGS